MARRREYILSRPFREWLEQRFICWEDRLRREEGTVTGGIGTISPAVALAQELGWDGESGMRRLWRFRFERKDGSINGVKVGGLPTAFFARDIVEEAMHEAGVNFDDLYIEYAHRMEGERGRPVDVLTFITGYLDLAADLCDGPYHREAYCRKCRERTLRDRDGQCIWCVGQAEFKALKLKRDAQQLRTWRSERQRMRAAA